MCERFPCVESVKTYLGLDLSEVTVPDVRESLAMEEPLQGDESLSVQTQLRQDAHLQYAAVDHALQVSTHERGEVLVQG